MKAPMNTPGLEKFLAKIYVDAEARARFLAAPHEESVRAGLTGRTMPRARENRPRGPGHGGAKLRTEAGAKATRALTICLRGD